MPNLLRLLRSSIHEKLWQSALLKFEDVFTGVNSTIYPVFRYREV